MLRTRSRIRSSALPPFSGLESAGDHHGWPRVDRREVNPRLGGARLEPGPYQRPRRPVAVTGALSARQAHMPSPKRPSAANARCAEGASRTTPDEPTSYVREGPLVTRDRHDPGFEKSPEGQLRIHTRALPGRACPLLSHPAPRATVGGTQSNAE